MTWVIVSLVVYSIILIWYFLCTRGFNLPSAPLGVRVFACLCVIGIAIAASIDYLLAMGPGLAAPSHSFLERSVLISTLLVLWVEPMAAIVGCLMLISNGNPFTLRIQVH